MGEKGKKGTNLFAGLLNLAQHVGIRRLGEARLFPAVGVVLKTLTDALGTVVERIAKRLMDTRQLVPAGHEHL